MGKDGNGIMIFPDEEYLEDYKDSDFGSVVSTMMVEGMIRRINDFRLGDSAVTIALEPMGKGPEGMEAFKRNCKKVRESIDEAAVTMKEKKFIDFFTWAKEDYDKNGVIMPMVGKVI